VIITSTVAAMAQVSTERLVRYGDDAKKQTERALFKAMRREGEAIGAFIREESIWVTVGARSERDDVTYFDALWSPNPEAGVLLIGGPADGECIVLHREGDGRPMPRFAVRAGGETAGPLVEPTKYEREGIDSERDMWVYRHRP